MIDIERYWTLADIARAHQVLDAFQDADVRISKKIGKK
jgi:hypothetical protein